MGNSEGTPFKDIRIIHAGVFDPYAPDELPADLDVGFAGNMEGAANSLREEDYQALKAEALEAGAAMKSPSEDAVVEPPALPTKTDRPIISLPPISATL